MTPPTPTSENKMPSQTDEEQPPTPDEEENKYLLPQFPPEWNNTQTDFPSHKCIHQLFEEQVQLTFNSVAVEFGDQQLTYSQLNNSANQVAHYLQTLGVEPEVLVGIYVERSLLMIVGLLGILKAGGAYVPLDPDSPRERVDYMLSDSQLSVLLTQKHLVDSLPSSEAQIICLDRDWELIAAQSEKNPLTEVKSSNLAYVIYTSGSTGKPKGVTIEHRSLVNFTCAAKVEYGISSHDRVLQFASISFDTAGEEIYPCLTSGGTLVLRTKEMLDSVSIFLQKCREWKLTMLHLPTAFWHQLTSELATTDEILPSSVGLIVFGGEGALSEKLKLWQKCMDDRVNRHMLIAAPKLMNGYGPTEATIAVTFCKLLESVIETKHSNVPIGKPIANVQLYILDQQLQPVHIGVSGELYIGGISLARGYLDRPELTADKFIPNPFKESERLYKTGDLARYLSDGNIELLGRIDNQVKIRGFRIELGEIEAALAQHPAVRETVVIAREDIPDHKYLEAYIVLNYSWVVPSSDLRDFLKEKLPGYMIPRAFVMLDALPLTPNGKVDRRTLHKCGKALGIKKLDTNPPNLEVDITRNNKGEDTTFSTTDGDSIRSTLRSLVASWLQQDISEIDISATFLELGTDSLTLLEAVRSIQVKFEINVEVRQFFEELATLDALATYIEDNLRLKQQQKNFQEPELKPISLLPQQPKSKPSQLAKTKVLDSHSLVSAPKFEAMNRQNRKLVPETNIQKIIEQQIQLMSQQLELLGNEPLRTEESLLAEIPLTESTSAKPFHQSGTVTNKCPVCSYNEWDPLEEVIVGIVDGAMISSWHTIHRATVLPGQEKQLDNLSKRTEKQPLPYPEWLVQAATKCLDEFVHILESEGVVVRRPEVVDYSTSFRTPSWEVMNGFCAANPRDAFLVIGNEIIEAPMADRGRYFESWAYRSLLKEYLKAGAKWSAAPKPQLLDALYDPDYKIPKPGEEMRFVITEFEPTFDAADFVRLGRDIFVQKSHVTNSLGIEWVQRHLGDEYRVHVIESRCPQALHIDTTLVPLAPGKVLINPVNLDVNNLPDYFKSWDILIAPEPDRTPMTLYGTKVISNWVNMNILSLDEERVIVEKSQESMIRALKDWGFKPIPCDFESYYPFLGSFHCATLDIRRRGTLRSYEMEEGTL